MLDSPFEPPAPRSHPRPERPFQRKPVPFPWLAVLVFIVGFALATVGFGLGADGPPDAFETAMSVLRLGGSMMYLSVLVLVAQVLLWTVPQALHGLRRRRD